MKVSLLPVLNDPNLDAAAPSTQRQLAISVSAMAREIDSSAPSTLCLILPHSGSRGGRPLETVKQAAGRLLERLKPGDRFCAVAFDHKANDLVPNQIVDDHARLNP